MSQKYNLTLDILHTLDMSQTFTYKAEKPPYVTKRPEPTSTKSFSGQLRLGQAQVC